MLGGRRKLPVLAEISGPDSDRTRVFSLRRDDLARLADLCDDLTRRDSLLVTGGEGVARTVAIAVAGASCAAGRRVVLVDCDLEEPRLAAELGLAEAPGVHEYLRWEANAPELLQPIALAGSASAGATAPLTFIAAGRRALDARILLGLQSFRHMASKLRSAYDLVVLAGPALGPPDGMLPELAKEADAVLAGFTPEQARGRAARAARAAIRPLAPEALGAVVVGAVAPAESG
jgi:polysaccharide biosynthesis transport protein